MYGVSGNDGFVNYYKTLGFSAESRIFRLFSVASRSPSFLKRSSSMLLIISRFSLGESADLMALRLTGTIFPVFLLYTSIISKINASRIFWSAIFVCASSNGAPQGVLVMPKFVVSSNVALFVIPLRIAVLVTFCGI